MLADVAIIFSLFGSAPLDIIEPDVQSAACRHHENPSECAIRSQQWLLLWRNLGRPLRARIYRDISQDNSVITDERQQLLFWLVTNFGYNRFTEAVILARHPYRNPSGIKEQVEQLADDALVVQAEAGVWVVTTEGRDLVNAMLDASRRQVDGYLTQFEPESVARLAQLLTGIVDAADHHNTPESAFAARRSMALRLSQDQPSDADLIADALLDLIALRNVTSHKPHDLGHEFPILDSLDAEILVGIEGGSRNSPDWCRTYEFWMQTPSNCSTAYQTLFEHRLIELVGANFATTQAGSALVSASARQADLEFYTAWDSLKPSAFNELRQILIEFGDAQSAQ